VQNSPLLLCPGFGLKTSQALDGYVQCGEYAICDDLRHDIRTHKGVFDLHVGERNVLI
jgi:hypothetical protein